MCYHRKGQMIMEFILLYLIVIFISMTGYQFVLTYGIFYGIVWLGMIPLVWCCFTRLRKIKSSEISLSCTGKSDDMTSGTALCQSKEVINAAYFAHELKTPLNAILGFSEILEKELLGPAPSIYKDYATRIHTSASYLLKVANQMLDYMKLEGPLSSPCLFEEVDLQTAVEQAVQIASGFPGASSKSFSIEASHKRICISADKTQISQALLNVLSNAVKFTSEKGRIKISIGYTQFKEPFICVSDNGSGILKKDLPHIGTPFFRGNYARPIPGSGLGLALVQRIMAIHKGHFSITSVWKKGTRVCLSFPPIKK